MFWENFCTLCKNVGKSPNAVAKELSLSSGSVTFWKKGKVPHHSTLLKIADYFGVTVDYLLSDNQKEKTLTADDERKTTLIGIFNLLDEAGQDALIEVARRMKKPNE